MAFVVAQAWSDGGGLRRVIEWLAFLVALFTIVVLHELGHALGYNHVHSRASIMNPQIGSEPTDIDRAVARVAFQTLASPSSCS